jgi:hypothetical protein
MNNTVAVVAAMVGEGVVVGDAVADEEAEQEDVTMADEEDVVVEPEAAEHLDEELVLEEDVPVGGDEDAEPIKRVFLATCLFRQQQQQQQQQIN